MNGKTEWGTNPIPRVRIENHYEAKIRMREEMAKERSEGQNPDIQLGESQTAKHTRSADANKAPLKRARLSNSEENDPEPPDTKMNSREQKKWNSTALAANQLFGGLANRNGAQKKTGNKGCTDEISRASLREGPDPGLSEGCLSTEKAKTAMTNR